MPTAPPFSAVLRERSSGAHSDSEGQGFMVDLLEGEGTRDDYASLVAQHFFVYAALEAAAERLKADTVAACFITERLTRLPSLEADLEFLLGTEWRARIAPLPATSRYAARIEEVGAGWPGGFVAHHYTRYLGDLSGGIFIGRALRRRFGLGDGGVRFYTFDGIADPRAFKDDYRRQLDDAPWDDHEREGIIDEVLAAYRFNGDLLQELEERQDRTAVA